MKGLSRAEATRGVEQRLDATLHAHAGLRLAPIPPALLRPPPGPGARILRGGHLPHLGETAGDVYDDIRHLWEESGCRVEDRAGPDGRVLVVHDPAGYVITLTHPPGDADPTLTVASPRVPAEMIDRGLLAGLLSGIALGCGGPCLFSAGPMTAFPSLAGLAAPFWGWIPLYLLVGVGSAWLPESRKFGLGLLAGGAVVGISVAGIFA
ncbi:hypothetical protein Ade02nite_12410 [Paractinoplanes deccanensis]|uniref:Uncharacterized protein n=1 Tax=Paractinoplanes deccanensis TaxID=113561 RepID=A0ABQ3XY61_9ACTN|nr:hypothetical protein [Actinoplanes deccanensis]GID72600.1 hypothetical protein Ade02nite_12410 [Actinoplanes deccanensis]